MEQEENQEMGKLQAIYEEGYEEGWEACRLVAEWVKEE